MHNSKHEDAFMKMGVEYFREHILKLLGINYSYEEIGPTELVALTINELYMDFTFKTTEEDLYIHIECKADIRNPLRCLLMNAVASRFVSGSFQLPLT